MSHNTANPTEIYWLKILDSRNYNFWNLFLYYLGSYVADSEPFFRSRSNDKCNGREVKDKCENKGRWPARIQNTVSLHAVKSIINDGAKYWTGLRWDGSVGTINNWKNIIPANCSLRFPVSRSYPAPRSRRENWSDSHQSNYKQYLVDKRIGTAIFVMLNYLKITYSFFRFGLALEGI